MTTPEQMPEEKPTLLESLEWWLFTRLGGPQIQTITEDERKELSRYIDALRTFAERQGERFDKWRSEIDGEYVRACNEREAAEQRAIAADRLYEACCEKLSIVTDDLAAMKRRAATAEAVARLMEPSNRQCMEANKALHAERAALAARVRELEADAERYRWLKDQMWAQSLTKVYALPVVWKVDYPDSPGREMDAAIDAAREPTR